ncbi:hypothetical protein PCE1_004976 [Barthelona sp. PCE]
MTDLMTDITVGLTTEVVNNRLDKYGPNDLPPAPTSSFFRLLLEQFNDRMSLFLLFSCLLNVILIFWDDEPITWRSVTEPGVVLLILAANGVIGVLQDLNAEKAVLSLKQFEVPMCKVLRDDSWHVVESVHLVPGDVIELTVGDMVPADCVVRSFPYKQHLEVVQSAFTGETNTFFKDAFTGTEFIESAEVDLNSKTMVFSGTRVASGRAICTVTHTGRNRVLGGIQDALFEDDGNVSPLTTQLDVFGEQLWWIIVVICALVFVINIKNFTLPEHSSKAKAALYYFKTAIALAVAALPEGLPTVLTIVTALGSRRMAKKSIIVRRQRALETLGCGSVLCTDKTQTMTTNRMVAHTVCYPTDEYEEIEEHAVQHKGFLPFSGAFPEEFKGITNSIALKLICVLCNHSKLEEKREENNISVRYFGSPTEASLMCLGEKLGVCTIGREDTSWESGALRATYTELVNRYEIEHLEDFTRERKMMTIVVRDRHTDQVFALTKGSPSIIRDTCSSFMNPSEKQGSFYDKRDIRQFDTFLRNAVGDVEHKMALEHGSRILGFAIKPLADKYDLSTIEENMTYVGFVCIQDPPKETVRPAMEDCRKANVRVMMITGDSLSTALSVALETSLIDKEYDHHTVLSGAEWNALSDEDKVDHIKTLRVLALATPMHKREVVELLQAEGEVVVMVGDGVNDAAAIKRADVGVAMCDGSDVTKQASDMILLNNDFATLTNAAIREGRIMFFNCLAFLKFLISSNFGEVACIFFATLLNLPSFLSPVQLLWVNLVTDGLPATALSFNKPDKNIMKQKPRKRNEKLVTTELFIRMVIVGIYIGVATVFAYCFEFVYAKNGPGMSWSEFLMFCKEMVLSHELLTPELQYSMAKASTHALSVLVVIEMFNAWNCLSFSESIFTFSFNTNWLVLFATLLSLLQHYIILVVPFLREVFGVVPYNVYDWIFIIAISLPVVLVEEVYKYIYRRCK